MPETIDDSSIDSPSKSGNTSRLQNHYSQSRQRDENFLIEWENIEYSLVVTDSKNSKFLRKSYEEKKILKSLNGSAESGQLLAIMGPTGCGKTSLLNVLAARVPNGGSANFKLAGKISVNGSPRNDEDFRRVSAYVLQDDKLYPHLTVFETFLLAAHFYLSDDVTLEAKHSLVEDVISELGLVKVRDTIIGDDKIRGVSGGERKRANVGVQLISDPAVLLLDEPTSGLDSFQALAVMESMKALAMNGRLVVCVIHQPRSSIFDMCDQLLLLSEGHAIFQGPAHAAAGYFHAAGHPCPKLFNPSDFFLDILSPDNRSSTLESASQLRINTLAKHWNSTKAAESTVKSEKDMLEFVALKGTSNNTSVARFTRNLQLLCWRAWVEQAREIPTLRIKICVTFFFALILGGIYSNAGYSQKSIQNRQGLLFVITINQGFNACLGVLNTFPREKIIVNRERSTNAYDTVSYFFAKYLVEMPLNLLPCFLFCTIVYWMVGLNPSANAYGCHILIVMMEVMTSISLGLCISAVVPNVEVANVVGPIFVVITLLFGGFYINISSLPIVANWIPYASFMKWTYQSLCINEFRGEIFECNAGGGACEKTGEDVLFRLSFAESIEQSCLGLGMVMLVFTCLAIFLLHNSRLKYVSLGFAGANFKSRIKNQ